LLNQHIGSCRFIYNRSLAENIEKYSKEKKFIFKNEASKNLTQLKKEEEYEWLKLVNSQSLQGVIAHLDTALQRFLKKISGFPTFHKKSHGGSFSIPQHLRVEDDKVYIPKFKEGIKFVKHREISGEIRNATINNKIGIDLGIKDFAITSDAEIIENPKFLKRALKKLRYFQSQFAKIKFKNRKRTTR